MIPPYQRVERVWRYVHSFRTYVTDRQTYGRRTDGFSIAISRRECISWHAIINLSASQQCFRRGWWLCCGLTVESYRLHQWPVSRPYLVCTEPFNDVSLQWLWLTSFHAYTVRVEFGGNSRRIHYSKNCVLSAGHFGCLPRTLWCRTNALSINSFYLLVRPPF